jgi:glucan 1,3-beta-glucosidase
MRLLAFLLAVLIASFAFAGSNLPALRADGTRMIGPDGKAVILRGCNLGNWLMIEPWMLGGCIEAQDQGHITDLLRQRFGDERGYNLLELYRQNYITPRDFELVKHFGFNVVRVPFDYRLLQDEKPPYAMRPDAFKWLDRALELAEQAGVYVILDMHGVPAGQSDQMHTGRSNQNPEIYDDPAAQQRMIDLWTAIAKRYKDRSSIAAYDLVNEPYGDYKSDVDAPLRDLMFRAYESVRSTGDQHVILFPSTLGKGIYLYGDVRGRGFTQFAFTDHFYPGLFGSPSTIQSHAQTIGRDFPQIQSYLEAQQAPFLAGEFNVVLDRCGGERMMRRYYDEFAKRGWMATMWSYKLLKLEAGVQADDWYLVTNAQPVAEDRSEERQLRDDRVVHDVDVERRAHGR